MRLYGNFYAFLVRELPPLVEMAASWSMAVICQVYPSSKGRSSLDYTKVISLTSVDSYLHLGLYHDLFRI